MFIASIKPDRITVRYEHNRPSAMKLWEDKMFRQSQPIPDNLKKKKETWKLSYQSKRKIQDSAAYLSIMSTPRTIKVSDKKYIYNFKTSFITLTLPSQQQHEDKEIKRCLNNFLTTMRTRYGWNNYIWKAELQKNENIHFHIITDQFTHWAIIRHTWNNAINTLGYVDRYQEKFKNLSLREYAKERKLSVQESMNAWLYGNKTKWKSPGTENVKSITNAKTTAYYIAKYISKDSGTKELTETEKGRIKNFGRTWGRSQSLSRINYVTRYCWNSLEAEIKKMDEKMESFAICTYDYCNVLYINFENITPRIKRWLQKIMWGLAQSYHYPIPGT